MPLDLVFRPVPAGSGDGARMAAEMRELYWDVRGGLDPDAPDMPKAGPAELGPLGGTFLVGYHDGSTVCAGGIKRLPDDACEIKRMYVAPTARSATSMTTPWRPSSGSRCCDASRRQHPLAW
jgi:hypothetical protein